MTATGAPLFVTSTVSPARTRRIVAVRLPRSPRIPIRVAIVTTLQRNPGAGARGLLGEPGEARL